ncbi:MAG: sigma-70 family RNA polymerase sigma factor [Ignavibacteriae bacterium]|nr:sigma-70 family RNA polymerase sigma factor [Ignavibacteriota bacterium]
MTDEELVTVFKSGKVEAFNELIGRFKDPLVNYIYRYLGDFDEADDIVQDTFVRVFRHIDQYQPIAKFSTWIYTIATNLARTQYQRRKRWGIFSFGHRDDEDDERSQELRDEQLLPDAIADGSLLHEQIQQALNKLAPVFREVIVLYEIEEKSYEEICEITGQNMGTVKSRLNRARAKLQLLLKEFVSE